MTSIYPPAVLLPVKRIIAIGDIHGDYKAMLLALRKARVIDNKNNWIGGKTVVVQVGDQIDRAIRGDSMKDEASEVKIMNYFDRLHEQAKKHGGAVYSLLGNHELMNVMGDFSYVSKKGIDYFGGAKNRLNVFQPGGRIAKKLARTRNVILRIGNTVFVHGGITPRLAKKYKIIEINNMMRQYLMGNKDLENTLPFRELFLNNGSLLWTRRLSEDKPDTKMLNDTLNYLGAKRIVVGHTPQDKINSKFYNKIWRIDVGMSEAFGKRKGLDRIQVLEIINDGKQINII